jgi:rhodanese-related sulfurtransferase
MAHAGEIDPRELRQRFDRGEDLLIVDVREAQELALARFPRAMHVPMGELPSRLAELDSKREIVVVCHHGIRSAQVAMYLAANGFERVSNLSGGIDAWSTTVDPSTPRY